MSLKAGLIDCLPLGVAANVYLNDIDRNDDDDRVGNLLWHVIVSS